MVGSEDCSVITQLPRIETFSPIFNQVGSGNWTNTVGVLWCLQAGR